MLDVLFIDPCERRELRQEINGTLLLCTRLLEAGFSVDILRFWQIESYQKDFDTFVDDLAERILEMEPKCVSFYSLWPQYHTAIFTARRLKACRPELTVVFGGPQPTATAQKSMEVIEAVDYICAGEGENTVVPFFTALLRNGGRGLEDVPGVYRRGNGCVVGNALDVPLRDLNDLPRWDERLYLAAHSAPEPGRTREDYWMPLDVGRGCPFHCTFCATSRFWSRTYRLKSPQRIVEDMEYFMEKFQIHSFSFAHDAFTVNKKLVTQVCDQIIEKGMRVTWKCTTRVDCVDEELIIKMKQAGLRMIELGVETGSPRMQQVIGKNLDVSRVREVVRMVRSHGLRVILLFMYGFPEETEDDLRQTVDLVFDMLDSGVDYVNMSYCHFCPGTPMTRQYFDDLVLDPNIKMLERTVWGHESGEPLFRQHKELFPFRYHLETPVRNEYQYLHFLVRLYLLLPRTRQYLRNLYGGDSLKMYRDLYEHNREFLDQGYDKMEEIFGKQTMVLVDNMLRDFEPETAWRMRELIRFDVDLFRVRRGEERTMQSVYGFHYFSFVQKKPLGDFAQGSTEILLRKKEGKLELQVVRFVL